MSRESVAEQDSLSNAFLALFAILVLILIQIGFDQLEDFVYLQSYGEHTGDFGDQDTLKTQQCSSLKPKFMISLFGVESSQIDFNGRDWVKKNLKTKNGEQEYFQTLVLAIGEGSIKISSKFSQAISGVSLYIDDRVYIGELQPSASWEIKYDLSGRISLTTSNGTICP